jgi:hypothetical protein
MSALCAWAAAGEPAVDRERPEPVAHPLGVGELDDLTKHRLRSAATAAQVVVPATAATGSAASGARRRTAVAAIAQVRSGARRGRRPVVGDVHTEVARQPGQPVGVALAHRAHPPRARAPVDLDEQRDRLGGHRRRPEPGERPFPRVGEHHGRQCAHGRVQVFRRRDDDHALGAAAQRVGRHREP